MTKNKFGYDKIECNLISAYIESRDLFVKCEHLVSSAIFQESHTRWAYKKVKEFHQKQIKPDITLLFAEARKESLPTEFTALLGGLIGHPYEYSTQPEQYVIILFKRYVANYLNPLLEDAATKLQSYSDDSLEIMYGIKEAITKVELVVNNVSKEKSSQVVFDEAMQRITDLKNNVVEQNGFTFGLKNLDERTGGIDKGINVIGAVPGAGKTSLLINIIINNAIRNNVPVLFFSLEMPSIEIMTNMIANYFQINSRALRQGSVDDEQELTIKEMRDRIKSNFVIDDTGGISWQYVESKVRAFKSNNKIGSGQKILVLIDYLQLMQNSPEEWKGTNDEQRISITCNQLTRIAKNDNIGLVLLSQLSRPEKDRKNPRPRMSDLKGSGAIEACAILILLMFRPDYHGINEDEKGTDLRGLCEINPVKGRYIKPEPIYARFLGKYSQFLDYNPDDNGIKSNDADAF